MCPYICVCVYIYINKYLFNIQNMSVKDRDSVISYLLQLSKIDGKRGKEYYKTQIM